MPRDMERTTVTLRLPKDLIDKIDELRAEKPFGVPRNTWIAEAVVMRVQLDSGVNKTNSKGKISNV